MGRRIGCECGELTGQACTRRGYPEDADTIEFYVGREKRSIRVSPECADRIVGRDRPAMSDDCKVAP